LAAEREAAADRLAMLTEARADARARAERAERQVDELSAELRAARTQPAEPADLPRQPKPAG
jgi:hypothetical protein